MAERTTNLFESKAVFTNEERRVSIYSDTEPPIVPGEVTQDTPLEELNLNWRERGSTVLQQVKYYEPQYSVP